jgi:PIN like domain
LRFFFDNTMSDRLVEALRVLDRANELVHLRQRFLQDTPDAEWISTLAKETNWVVVSGDLRITRNPAERKAWRESGLVAFFLEKSCANLTLEPSVAIHQMVA